MKLIGKGDNHQKKSATSRASFAIDQRESNRPSKSNEHQQNKTVNTGSLLPIKRVQVAPSQGPTRMQKLSRHQLLE